MNTQYGTRPGTSISWFCLIWGSGTPKEKITLNNKADEESMNIRESISLCILKKNIHTSSSVKT